MLRQVSSRNHRAKGGFRAKNAFQVSILVAVCVWLLYQMKYSHDHRKAYEEKFGVDGSRSEIARFPRKELLPRADAAEDAPGEGKRDVGARGDGDGKKGSGAAQEQEHEEHSHEAREKSFRGDDASSEVMQHGQEVEHEEQTTQEARERSFRADDASSAVDHGAPLKEEAFDSSNSTSSLVQEHKTNATSLEEEEKSPSSLNATHESDDGLEEESVVDIVAHINNGTDPRKFQANELELQRELRLFRSRNLSKEQTAKSGGPAEEARRNQTAVADPKLVNRTALHSLQELENEAVVVVRKKKKSDRTARSQTSGEQPKTSRVTSEESKAGLPLNATAEEKRDGHEQSHNLQNKVKSQKEDAAE